MRISSNSLQALIGVALVAVLATFTIVKHKRDTALIREHGIEIRGQIVQVLISAEKRSALETNRTGYVEKVCRSRLGRDQVVGNSFGRCQVHVTYEFESKDRTRHRGNWNFETMSGVANQVGQPITVKYVESNPSLSSVVIR